MNIFQVRLEQLATEFLAASDKGEDTSKIVAKIEELKFIDNLTASLTTPAPKKGTVRVEKEKKGRKTYSESEVIKNTKELAVAIQYKQYIGNEAQTAIRVEFILMGKVKDPRNGATGFLTALKSCEDIADLKRGEVYAFRNSTLNTMEVLG